MKKTLLSTLFVAMVANTTIAMDVANIRVTATPISEDMVAYHKIPASISKWDLLVNENFDNCILGTFEEPDFDQPLALIDTHVDIDPSLTHGEQWYGHKIYQAGGAIAMQSLSMDQCILNTPRMDYSGSVRLSFLTRALVTTWIDEEGIERWDNSAHLIVGISEEKGRPIETNARGNLADLQLYADMGWMEVTIEFDNYSPYSNASIVFAGTNTLLIDDVNVMSSCDEFIPAPIVTGITDVTEDSFTIHWEKMRKSYNYYIWLYSSNGIDPETGEEILTLELPKETRKWLNEAGMSIEEYIESKGGMDSPYLNYDIVNRYGDMSYKFTNLDPNTDYYFAVMSHNVFMFSEKKLIKVTELATPTPLEATDITPTSFTANWSEIKKADSYIVDFYGVNVVEETSDEYEIFYEDFDKTSQLSTATDPYDATPCTADMTMNDVVSNPGWEINGPLALEIPEMGEMPLAYMLDGWFGPAMNLTLTTPLLYVANNDHVNISMHLMCVNPEAPIVMQFAGSLYMADMGGMTEVTAEITLPTNGLEQSKLELACMDQEGSPLFIDYISITQPLEKGDMLFTSLGNSQVLANETSLMFDGLDNYPFNTYAYSVTAFKNDGRQSATSDRNIVALDKGTNKAKIILNESQEPIVVAIYSLDGRQLSTPVPGLNIIKYNDGSIEKIYVK